MKYPISAKRISDCLHEYNMSAQDLANETGLNKASISQYVNGKNVPNNVNAGKIAKVFNVKPAWIMGFDVDMTSIEDKREMLMKAYETREQLDYIMNNPIALEIASNLQYLNEDQQKLIRNLVADLAANSIKLQ